MFNKDAAAMGKRNVIAFGRYGATFSSMKKEAGRDEEQWKAHL